jgi:hypothetical protein
MKQLAPITLAALIALLGCGEQERPKAEPAPLPPPALPAPEPEPAAPRIELEPNADELPVPEDFEPEAEAEITAANYREELDKLEREIAAQR